jgi:hypothetical protein
MMAGLVSETQLRLMRFRDLFGFADVNVRLRFS